VVIRSVRIAGPEPSAAVLVVHRIDPAPFVARPAGGGDRVRQRGERLIGRDHAAVPARRCRSWISSSATMSGEAEVGDDAWSRWMVPSVLAEDVARERERDACLGWARAILPSCCDSRGARHIEPLVAAGVEWCKGDGMNVLLIGPPGSGKGTQGERLAARLGLEHLAAGDLLRAEVEKGTPLGRRVADMMQRGELVPDAVIISLLMPRVLAASAAKGYLLDGFPRSLEQAQEARKLAELAEAGPDAVVYLDAPREELVRRILHRAQIEGRADDNPETVTNRLRVFDEATRPLVDYYRGRGLLHVVNADQHEDEVTDDILAALGVKD
jgi:adenylate kinase